MPMAMITCPARITVSGAGLFVNVPSSSRSASTSAPVRSRTCASRIDVPAIVDDGWHHELLEAELDVPLVHHDVEELGDVRLHDERGHPRAADALRVHDPVGAGVPQLLLVLGDAHAGDDEEVGLHRPRADA